MIRSLPRRCCLLVALIPWVALPALARAPKKLELKDGDRIVFLGDGLFEGEYEHGYIETAITSRFPDLHLTFRNLGWTGDTVWGDARAGFDTAKEGFARRTALVKELKPNVILVCYGMNESFAGEAGLPRFEEGLKALLDSLKETRAKIVLIGPIKHERVPAPLPDPAQHNAEIEKYRHAMKRVAHERDLQFVDLLPQPDGTGWPTTDEQLTLDGIHLNATGYWMAANVLPANLFGGDLKPLWSVALERDGKPDSSGFLFRGIVGTELADVKSTKDRLRFKASDRALLIVGPKVKSLREEKLVMRFLRVKDVDPGRYALSIDGNPIVVRSSEEWSGEGRVHINEGPEITQAEALRRAIVEKNELLFHRLRPQNETYLYLFRKQEQGHMAGEVPQFDPLIAEKEAEIDRLKKPVPHTYELIRVEEKK